MLSLQNPTNISHSDGLITTPWKFVTIKLGKSGFVHNDFMFFFLAESILTSVLGVCQFFIADAYSTHLLSSDQSSNYSSLNLNWVTLICGVLYQFSGNGDTVYYNIWTR